MSPDRKKIINGKKIEEYYWNGEMVCYVDNYLSKMTFDEVVELEEKYGLNKTQLDKKVSDGAHFPFDQFR